MRAPGHAVFLSYASEDGAPASRALHGLEERGIRCWMAPRDVVPGTPYPLAILDAINASSILVVVFSSHADASPQVLREVERAVSKGLAVIPYRIEDVRPSGAMEYLISATHWLDAFALGAEEGPEALAEAVSKALDESSGSPPAPEPDPRPPTRPAAGPGAWDPRSAITEAGRGALAVAVLFGTFQALVDAISGRPLPVTLLGEILRAVVLGAATGLAGDLASALLSRVLGSSFLAPVFARGIGGTLGGLLVEAFSGAGLWGLLPAAGGVGGLVAALGHRRPSAVVAGSAVGGYLGYLLWRSHPELMAGPDWGLAAPLILMVAGSVAAALAGGDARKDAGNRPGAGNSPAASDPPSR